jgi:probable phosphoglycerate mutase
MAGEVVIVRHADTDWTISGQHTGRTDIPLNERGREVAAALPGRLRGRAFVAVWTSPLSRARETAQLAGYPDAQERAALVEWDYGDYEGLTRAQILADDPTWDLWHDGCPGGETPREIGGRADSLLAALPPEGDVLIFSHGHMLRVLTARWLGLGPDGGALFALAPGGIGVLGYEHEQRVLRSLD